MFYTLRDTLEAVVKDTPPESDDSDGVSDTSTADSDDSNANNASESSFSQTDATPVVIRIAARAAILVIDKYLGLIWNCDLYILALGIFYILPLVHLY